MRSSAPATGSPSTQEQINTFADATGDHQWIHVDPERAATGPFGGTIAHGYLTLSLLPVFAEQIYDIQGLAFGMNYGANKVRFPAPVPVDSRLRATATLKETNDIAIGTQVRHQLRRRARGRRQAGLHRRGRLRHGRSLRCTSPSTTRPTRLIEQVTAFMDAEVYPAEPILKEQIEESADRPLVVPADRRWSCGPRPRRRGCGTSSCPASTAPA